MDQTLIFAGVRSLQANGDSIVIAAPKRELRDVLGEDPDELTGETVTVSMDESGKMTVDFSCLCD